MKGQQPLKKIPGVFLLNKFPYSEKGRPAVNLNEPKIIVVESIKQNSKTTKIRL